MVFEFGTNLYLNQSFLFGIHPTRIFECHNNLTNSTYFASTALDESIENIDGPIISNLIGAVKFELGALNCKFSHLQF